MKVGLTLQTLNFAEPCVTFSCIDYFAFDEIKWQCSFTKHTVILKKTKSKKLSLLLETSENIILGH